KGVARQISSTPREYPREKLPADYKFNKTFSFSTKEEIDVKAKMLTRHNYKEKFCKLIDLEMEVHSTILKERYTAIIV
ncbi:hypothetical protein GBAR_LOCUS13217, partial [Geodia barretti]